MGWQMDELKKLTGDALEGYEIMEQVFSIMLNREEIGAQEIADYLNDDSKAGIDGLYEDYVGRAVDHIERVIREETTGETKE